MSYGGAFSVGREWQSSAKALSFGKFWASKWDPALLPTARSKMGWAGVKAVEFGWFLHAVEATKRGQVSSARVQTLG